ncbi:MAG: GNAT family N-acetyltransferase [Hyphomicrobium sp.]|nr:GNAT family N-acetyltransferase [Hyphomicrobium sp.]
MAFLRSPAPEDYLAPIRGRSVTLRPPAGSDYANWAELRALSRQHLTRWEPTWAHDDLSRAMFRRRLRAYGRDVRDDLGYSFFIADAMSDALLGGITLSNVRRGSAQSASLGYWIGAPYAGGGRMQDAVLTLLPFAFGALRLHRIEAASMPANTASIRVLEKTGFEREGIARSFLKINGQWQDHILYARLVGDPGIAPTSLHPTRIA